MALAVVRGREKRSRARLAAQEAAPKIPGVLQDIVRSGTTSDLQKRLRRDIFMIIAKKRINSDASYRENMWRIMLARHNLRDLHEQAIQSAADFES